MEIENYDVKVKLWAITQVLIVLERTGDTNWVTEEMYLGLANKTMDVYKELSKSGHALTGDNIAIAKQLIKEILEDDANE